MKEERYDISAIDLNPSRNKYLMIGILIILWICALIVAIRMNYEATFLTWENGPQMIGFSFVHSSGAFLILALLCLIVITFIQMIMIVIKLAKKTKLDRQYVICFLVSIFFIVLNFIPYSIAQTCMIHFHGLPKKATSFFTNAAHDGDLRIMKLMMEKGYQPDSTVFTSSLYNACSHGYMDVIEFSMEHGANVNYQCKDYEITPLMIAAENDQVETIKYLIEHGADYRLRDNLEGKTALDYAMYYNNSKSISILSKYK